MKFKYYLLGLGVGIFITTLILSFDKRKEKLSDEEIISRARELGMVMKEEARDNLEEVIEKSLDKSGEQKEEHSGDDKKTDTDKSSDMNSSSNELPSSESESSENGTIAAVSDTEEKLNSSEAGQEDNADGVNNNFEIEKDVSRILDTENKTADNGEAENTNISENTTEKNTQANKPDTDVSVENKTNSEEVNTGNDSETEYVTFTVKSGMTSKDVSNLLYQVGLVADETDFNTYVKNMGKSRVILAGIYTLPKNASYEEILNTITKSSLHR
mgnify:CR=1 FL=1